MGRAVDEREGDLLVHSFEGSSLNVCVGVLPGPEVK